MKLSGLWNANVSGLEIQTETQLSEMFVSYNIYVSS